MNDRYRLILYLQNNHNEIIKFFNYNSTHNKNNKFKLFFINTKIIL